MVIFDRECQIIEMIDEPDGVLSLITYKPTTMLILLTKPSSHPNIYVVQCGHWSDVPKPVVSIIKGILNSPFRTGTLEYVHACLTLILDHVTRHVNGISNIVARVSLTSAARFGLEIGNHYIQAREVN